MTAASKALAAFLREKPKTAAKGSRSKYGNKKVELDGFTFDSQREAARWVNLRMMERAGQIASLERQVSYVLTANGVPIGKIKPDFRYLRDGQTVVEDVKSKPTMTQLFRWKAKHLAAEHGVKLELVF